MGGNKNIIFESTKKVVLKVKVLRFWIFLFYLQNVLKLDPFYNDMFTNTRPFTESTQRNHIVDVFTFVHKTFLP